MRPPLTPVLQEGAARCPGAEGRQEGIATPGACDPSDRLGSQHSYSVVTSREQVVERSGTLAACCETLLSFESDDVNLRIKSITSKLRRTRSRSP